MRLRRWAPGLGEGLGWGERPIRDGSVNSGLYASYAPNGDFTRAVGLELDASGFGMGKRSQRYAMVVKDGKVEQLHEPAGAPASDLCAATPATAEPALRLRRAA